MKIKDLYLCLLSTVSPKLSTKALYKRRIGKNINLKNPKTFNEKIQWLKLNVYPYDDIYTKCADKYAVRKYIKMKGCSNILTKLYGVYENARDINFDLLPNKFVLKWNFGCGLNIICEDKSKINRDEVIKKLNKWKHNKFYLKTSEMHYKKIDKKIICEEYLTDRTSKRIDDYKFYCFNGKPYCVMICVGRDKGKPKFYFFDRDWKFLRINKIGEKCEKNFTVKKPVGIDEMFKYAEILSSDFPFVRVDLYNVNGKIYFGELTFTPSAGVDTGYTDEGQLILGEMIK